MKKIGTGAFCECESRRCFVWPCCVELIPNLCFGGCNHLSGFHFEEGNCVQRIGSWVFSGCASLSSFICPGGVKSIGGDSFSCCVTLKFSFEDGSCWAIGSHCFRDCVSLCHFLVPVSVLLAIAPLARNAKGSVLFPARMHMLFRGISGVYACANADCPHAHSAGGLTLGEIFLSDGHLVCPHCGSVVYELYNDRRCGALFFKGYVLETAAGQGFQEDAVYLWRYPGQLMDQRMKEIHLFIPTDDFVLPAKQGKNSVKPCYLDVTSGFINFTDDSLAGKPGIRKLYWCDYSAKGRPQILTFTTCPHCWHQLSATQLTSFNTRGNLSFFNLIKAQFQLQPAVPGKDKDPDRFPNAGRKVLLFSDSRQRAAKLARDMSEASDIAAARQLFALALKMMEDQSTRHPETGEQSLDRLYSWFCLAAAQRHVQIFHGTGRIKFADDCRLELKRFNRSAQRGREFIPQLNQWRFVPVLFSATIVFPDTLYLF